MSETITIKDLEKAVKLLDVDNKKYRIKVCAECFSLGIIRKDHSKCSGNWFEIDKRTGTIQRFGISKLQAKILKREFFNATLPKGKGKPATFCGIPIIVSEGKG